MIRQIITDCGYCFALNFGCSRIKNIMNNKTRDKKILNEYHIEQLQTPVAFMIFNRPEYTRTVFAEIRKAQPKQLFIIADGPRTPSEAPLCEKTRAIVNQIDWPCEVHRNYAEKNLGLKERISSGLNWFFENVETGIILEDDCLPHQSFFRFATEMLEKYKDDERIMMISGDNFLPDFEIKDSYFFSRYFPIWGWATWRRAWKKYDIEMQSWKTSESKEFLKKIYPKTQKYMRSHMTKIFNEAYSGKINTWDAQWGYACLMSGGLCIVPKVNLVSNIGMLGIHTPGSDLILPTYDIYQKGTLKHPKFIEPTAEYDRIFYEKNFRPGPFNLRMTIISILVKYEMIKKIYRFFMKMKSLVR